MWLDGHLEQLIGTRVPLIAAAAGAGGNLAAVIAQKSHKAGRP